MSNWQQAVDVLFVLSNNNMIMKKILSILLFLVVVCQIRAEDTNITTMHKMTQRLFPQQASSFDFRLLNDTSADTFTIKSEGNKIIISGNNANSMAVGLNHYLKNYCLTTISWYKDDPIELPKTLPSISTEVTVKANVPTRFFLNYCTFGYSMTWWKWSDWEHFIDWMALNGVTMALATTGQEAVWQRVWRGFGLDDETIRRYFTGPSYLPWHRMANIDAWHGPLPQSWIDGQLELQRRIVARERELGIQPIFTSFTGHVPKALKALFPDADIERLNPWTSFERPYNSYYLNPAEPLFSRIQQAYMQEQRRLFGESSVYGVDPFNELDPPSWDPEYLARAARLRKACGLPLLLVGGIRSDAHIRQVLEAGLDMVSLCRPLICQPDLVLRLQQGPYTSPCLSCNQCFAAIGTEGRTCVLHTKGADRQRLGL